MISITYKFQETFLTPNPLELEKTLAIITSDGKVTVSYYKGKKRTVKRIVSVKPIDVENLISEMKKYERPIVFMDAVTSNAKITFNHGETITFNPAPWCLVEFINRIMEENA